MNRGYRLGTPIAEYVAEKLSNGKLVIVGDAAHILTPMTAKGFNSSIDDASILVDLVQESEGVDGDKVLKILEKFEKQRLVVVNDIVRSGQSFSRNYANY